MRRLEKTLPCTFSSKTALAMGVHPRDLYLWRDSGEIVELSRGIFRRADAAPASFPDLLAVAHRVPRAIICCVSAAAVHDLTDELPMSVQIAIPNGTHVPKIDFPPTQAFRFHQETFEAGLSQVAAAPG